MNEKQLQEGLDWLVEDGYTPEEAELIADEMDTQYLDNHRLEFLRLYMVGETDVFDEQQHAEYLKQVNNLVSVGRCVMQTVDRFAINHGCADTIQQQESTDRMCYEFLNNVFDGTEYTPLAIPRFKRDYELKK